MRFYPSSLLIVLTINRVSSSASLITGEIFSGAANPTLSEITRLVSSSLSEPRAIHKYRIYSCLVRRPYPSAMLAGTDTDARRI